MKSVSVLIESQNYVRANKMTETTQNPPNHKKRFFAKGRSKGLLKFTGLLARLSAGILTLTVCGLLILSVSGCDGKGENPTGKESRIITDMLGRNVEIPAKVEKIVCRGPGTLRMVTYLNATDKLAAIESGFELREPAGRPYRIAHPEFVELPTVGAAGPSPQPNPEAILKTGADVVFISYVTGRIADNLQQKTGIAVVVLDFGELATLNKQSFFASMRLVGKIVDKQERTSRVIEFLRQCEKDLRRRAAEVPPEDKSSVYVGGLGFKGSQGITSTECGYPAFDLLDAASVTSSLEEQGHIFLSKEKLLQWDPEIIFLDAGGLELIMLDYAKNPDYYRNLRAFRGNNVHVVFPYNFYTTNISTALADCYYIGKVMYPRAFADVAPEQKAGEIYDFLVGKDVYSQMEEDWPGFEKFDPDYSSK